MKTKEAVKTISDLVKILQTCDKEQGLSLYVTIQKMCVRLFQHPRSQTKFYIPVYMYDLFKEQGCTLSIFESFSNREKFDISLVKTGGDIGVIVVTTKKDNIIVDESKKEYVNDDDI